MSIIVTDTGFTQDTLGLTFTPLAELTKESLAVALGPTDLASALDGKLDQIQIIRISFPAFNDGRGFTIAHDLRLAGFKGRLRAFGHVLADQYAMARRAGFDEVEISEDLAKRQPQDQWAFRAEWRAHDHRSRLFG